MEIALHILFILSMGAILHTYGFYPWNMLQRYRKLPIQPLPKKPDPYPSVDVIFAAYNEEAVIEEKIRSVCASQYPNELLSLHIATDCPSDRTELIIKELQKEFSNLYFYPSKERKGKSFLINHLAEQSTAEIIIPTDANIIFNEKTITELVQALQNKDIGIAGACIHYQDINNQGIAPQEDYYLQRENKIKIAEGAIFGATMGVEGGCYAIRNQDFTPIPSNFFMEDFFQTLQVLEKGKKSILCESAIVWEDISTQSSQEFKRKVRISIGNFQNLKRFSKLLITQFWPVGYLFLSHKILRWLTPHLMLLMLGIALYFGFQKVFIYQVLLFLAGFSLLIAWLGAYLNNTSKWARMCIFVHHYYYMNIALALGFIKYLKGVKTNVWQPTKRKQAQA